MSAGRARAIKLVVSDWNGVLGDQAHDSFSLRDGVGVDRLREAGIRVVIMTRDRSMAIARRAQVLGRLHLFMGVVDKVAHLEMIAGDINVGLHEIAYISADENDGDVMREVAEVGLTAVPYQAPEQIAETAH